VTVPPSRPPTEEISSRPACPLVLLHGVGESAVGWQPVHQALSDHYDVIAFDLPGFGRSPTLPPEVTPAAAALADAIEGELDRLGVAQFHVAGYSLGARVALELATRGRTLSVIAIAPMGWARRWSGSTRRRHC